MKASIARPVQSEHIDDDRRPRTKLRLALCSRRVRGSICLGPVGSEEATRCRTKRRLHAHGVPSYRKQRMQEMREMPRAERVFVGGGVQAPLSALPLYLVCAAPRLSALEARTADTRVPGHPPGSSHLWQSNSGYVGDTHK